MVYHVICSIYLYIYLKLNPRFVILRDNKFPLRCINIEFKYFQNKPQIIKIIRNINYISYTTCVLDDKSKL